MNENQNPNVQAPEATEQELNQLRQVRRDKLAALQAEGDAPVMITKASTTG